jgi:CRP/FNR family transcriptional regulator, cyclic AMP receptor protein
LPAVEWGDPELIESLRPLPLFAGLDDLALAHIAAVSSPLEVASGHVLIDAGQEGAGLFVIQNGSVAVEIGARAIECGPGEFIGELSLLVDGLVHTGRVRAKTPVKCLALGRADFARLLVDEPQIAINMLRALARRLAETDRMLARD